MQKVTIVGAGLVGSLLAIYLGKRGMSVDVYEQRDDMRRVAISAGRSINLACSHRGWKALRGVGLEEKVKEDAIPMKGRMMHSISSELSFQPYGKKDEALYSVSRGALNKVLLEYAEKNPNVHIHFNKKCTDVDLDNNKIEFYDYITDEKIVAEAELIFGADGAYSAVREAMLKKSRFNYTQKYIEHGYKELSIPALNDDWALEKNYLHIWPRKQYMLIALPNKDKTFTCTLFLSFEGEKSFAKLQTEENVKTFFLESFPDVVPLIPNLTKEFFDNPTSSLITISCFPWCYNNKITLIGDAAHALVPFYGQGMVSGFEDVNILNDCFDNFSIENVLLEYQRLRKANADAISELALQNFIEMRDLVGDPKFLLRKKIEALIHNLHPEKYLPLYSMVTFSDIPYSEALQKGRKQHQMLDEMLEIDNIENIWQQSNFSDVIKSFLDKYNF